jgi:hypothetical protein
MVLEKSGMSHDTARILSFWQTLAASGRKSTLQRYNVGHLMSGGRVYCGSKSFVSSSGGSRQSFTLKILLFHRPCHYSDRGKLLALYNRHETVVAEMFKCGFSHKSSLKKELATGSKMQSVFVDQPARQQMILRNKRCKCKL